MYLRLELLTRSWLQSEKTVAVNKFNWVLELQNLKPKLLTRLLRGRFSSAGNYITYYSQLDKRPKYWHLALLAPMQVLRFQSEFVKLFPRVVRALSLGTEPLPRNPNLPQISIFVACIEKDLYLLPQVLSNAILNSHNPIRKISVVTPRETQVDIGNFTPLGVPIEFINEEDVISESIRIRLRERFSERYGWVLQQLLTITHVMNSDEAGILVINADTLILRPQVWLLDNDVQILMESYEFHRPYYEFLRRFRLDENAFKSSHITHHMLMQPKYLRRIYSEFIGVSFREIEYLVDQVVQYSNPLESSPVCVEFELYALGMRTRFGSLIERRKFGNISVDKNTYRESHGESFRNFNSISLHSYLS